MPTPLKGISASRGSAVLGLNKYKSPFLAWIEIMEQIEPGFCFKNGYEVPIRKEEWGEVLDPSMAAIRWGHGFEDAINNLVGDVINREKVYTHPKHKFLTTHVDGEKNGRNQENKTAFDMVYKKEWGEPGSDMIPKTYQIQVQHQMMLTGQEYTDVNVLVFPKAPAEWEKLGYRIDMEGRVFYPNGDFILNGVEVWTNNLNNLGYFHQYHVKADPELQKEMLDRYLTFWNENVLKRIPPPINGYDDIKWLFSSPEGELEATEEMKSLWSEKCDIENEISSMVDRVKEIKINFSKLVQIEKESLNIKPGNEPRKLNIYAGRRKLASISKPFPRLNVKKSMVEDLKEKDPGLYAEMKKVNFVDLIPEFKECMTDKQQEAFDNIDKEQQQIYSKLGVDVEKFVKKFKVSKLLEKKSIFSAMKKNRPDLYKFFYENSIVEESTPKSSLRMTSNKEE